MKQFLYSLLLLVSLFVTPGYAAVVCSDAQEFNDTSPTDPETISYTIPAGSNQVLFVGVGMRVGAGTTIDSATQAGNAMTAVAATAGNDPAWARMFYIINPTAGAQNVVVQYSATPLADAIIIFTCSGVNLAAPVHDATNATGGTSAVSVTVPSVLAGDVVVDMVEADGQPGGEPTEGADQTVFHKGSDAIETGWGSSQQPGSAGGVMSWTLNNGDQWAQQAVAISPAASTRRPISPIMLE